MNCVDSDWCRLSRSSSSSSASRLTLPMLVELGTRRVGDLAASTAVALGELLGGRLRAASCGQLDADNPREAARRAPSRSMAQGARRPAPWRAAVFLVCGSSRESAMRPRRRPSFAAATRRGPLLGGARRRQSSPCTNKVPPVRSRLAGLRGPHVGAWPDKRPVGCGCRTSAAPLLLVALELAALGLQMINSLFGFDDLNLHGAGFSQRALASLVQFPRRRDSVGDAAFEFAHRRGRDGQSRL